jgi:lysophospholipase L1-like esterase
LTRKVGQRQFGPLAAHIAAGVASVTLFAIGQNVDWGLITPVGDRAIARACTQVGSLALLVTGVSFLLLLRSAEAWQRFLTRSKKTIVVTTVVAIAMFAVGEACLRWLYRDGMSFSSHVGPIVQRFERDFKFNRYDGPSRGPDVAGPKQASEVRILFQGDSITWGQGVEDESLLYTNRLLARLRSEHLSIGAAVLAKPGRELDGHLSQLRKWGAEIQPDIIVYQWFINDMELNKSKRPQRYWQNAFFHAPLVRVSYLWFLLDYRMNLFLPSSGPTYKDYIRANYAVGTEGWTVFTEMFRTWTTEAKQLTPRVLVMLYSGAGPQTVFADFRGRMVNLCRQEGVAMVDLSPWIEARFTGDYTQMYVSQFDSHPNASVHDMMAKALYGQIKALWPNLFAYES